LASVFRVLIVDDFEPWRRMVRWMLQYFAEWQVVGEASDGVEAVQKTEKLQPDIILLDIGLPKINGIDAAKPILSVAPHSKIVFVSVELCPEFVQGALRTGAHGYVVKCDAASDLLSAMSTVMHGQRFVGRRFANCDFILPNDWNRT
jgi:DNA-binding NarL/FixJ family response regulator